VLARRFSHPQTLRAYPGYARAQTYVYIHIYIYIYIHTYFIYMYMCIRSLLHHHPYFHVLKILRAYPDYARARTYIRTYNIYIYIYIYMHIYIYIFVYPIIPLTARLLSRPQTPRAYPGYARAQTPPCRPSHPNP